MTMMISSPVLSPAVARRSVFAVVAVKNYETTTRHDLRYSHDHHHDHHHHYGSCRCCLFSSLSSSSSSSSVSSLSSSLPSAITMPLSYSSSSSSSSSRIKSCSSLFSSSSYSSSSSPASNTKKKTATTTTTTPNHNDDEKEQQEPVQWSIDIENKVGILTINSPKTYNALTVEIGHEFSTKCQRIRSQFDIEQLDLRSIILTGSGEHAFSAGGNSEWLQSLHDNTIHGNVDLMIRFYKSFLTYGLRLLPVPVIAVMNGSAMGAGAGLALSCDLRIAKSNVGKLFGFNFTRLGIHSGIGVAHLLSKTIHSSTKLNEILLLGQTLSSDQAYDVGLINHISDNPMLKALDISKQLATDVHPVALRQMIQTLRLKQDDGLDHALYHDAVLQSICYHRNDWGEGIKTILDKSKTRHPNFDPYDSP